MDPIPRLAAATSVKRSKNLYEIHVGCNKCGDVHNLGITVILEDGPVAKQSIGVLYKEKSLPKNLAELVNNSVSCPNTGRQSTQKNHQQIFLVPVIS